jgi:hypothetical protein
MSEPVVPSSLKPIERYLKAAKQLDKHQPVMAYFCMALFFNLCPISNSPIYGLNLCQHPLSSCARFSIMQVDIMLFN